MRKGVMWFFALVITTAVSGESQEANSSYYLDATITGFDPFYMSELEESNPGRRAKILQPFYTLNSHPNKTVLNSFVNEEQNRNYLPKLAVQKIGNFNKYRDFTASSAYELSSNTDCSAAFLRHVNYSSCTTKIHQRDLAMLQFFKDTGGEVLFAKADIVTHTITISSFEKTTFTPAFQRAVETLYKAALNPIPEVGKKNFNEFIRLYGTHFSRRTLLGSRAIFGKLFSTRAATNEEETARRQCVLDAARKALTPCMRGCNETTQTVFTKASSEICGGKEHEAIVAVSGPLPERSLDDWILAAKHSPNPIFYELEPLSTFFTTEWFEDYFDRIQVRINGTKLSQYFKEMISDYSRRMTSERLNAPFLRGCGLNSDCRIGTECRNEPDTETGFSCVPREEEATATTTTSTATMTLATTASTTSTTTTTLAPTTSTTATPCSSTCGCHLNAKVGLNQTLTSHLGFGFSNYSNHYYCVRRIYGGGKQVRIRFLSFDTEGTDYLYIYDGFDPTGLRMDILSGSPTLNTYLSRSKMLFLFFMTDSGDTRPGYSLLYEAVA